MVDVIRRADQANQPKSLAQVVDVIQELQPALGRKAARDTYDKTIRGKHKGEIPGCVKAQATTTARSAVTVRQPFRWHTLVSSLYAELVALNKADGFGDEAWEHCFVMLMEHFILNGDETCLMAN